MENRVYLAIPIMVICCAYFPNFATPAVETPHRYGNAVLGARMIH